MDVRIKDGDIAMLSSGGCEYIRSLDEAVQRVRISALTYKGDFIYDRALGTDYRDVSAEDEMLTEKLDMLIKEACADIHDTTVEVTSCDRDTLMVIIKIIYKNTETTTEVDLSGILR